MSLSAAHLGALRVRSVSLADPTRAPKQILLPTVLQHSCNHTIETVANLNCEHAAVQQRD